ncbi:hypothetical protein SAMN02910339_01641 [Lachnospiraceae bacterium YSD2013]|nr:hypothetical protein SAMN02910339_01641 [Lachnospiraceae bacterium YSD2013]
MIRRVNSVIAIIICATVLFYVMPVFTQAEHDGYEAREAELRLQPINIREIVSRYSEDYCEIKLEVTFEGDVNPPTTFFHTKVHGEKNFEGNLGIESIEYRKDVTDAFYCGRLY